MRHTAGMSRIYGLPSPVVRILLLVMLAVSVYALLADAGAMRWLGVVGVALCLGVHLDVERREDGWRSSRHAQ